MAYCTDPSAGDQIASNWGKAVTKHPAIPASYTVCKEGSTYYALPCFDGGTKYSSDTEATVLASAVAALPSGTGIIFNKTTNHYLFYENTILTADVGADGYFFAWGAVGGNNIALPFDLKMRRLERQHFKYLSRMEDKTDWSEENTVADDATVKVEGTQSIKITATNLGYSGITQTVALDLSHKHLVLYIKTDDIDNVRALYIRLSTSNPAYTDYYQSIRHIWPAAKDPFTDEGYIIDLNRNYFSVGAGAPDWADIKMANIRVMAESGVTGSVWVDDWRIIDDRYKGKVTLRFDDYKSSYLTVKPILDKYGYRGVHACVRDRDGAAGGAAGPTLAQLKEMYDLGWDIVAHGATISPHNYTTQTMAEREAEMQGIQKYLIENGMPRGARFHIPPSHAIPDWETMQLIQKYFLACQWRTDINYTALPPPNPYWLNCRLIGADNLATVEGFIDTALATNTWLTIYNHGAHASLEDIVDYLYNNNVEVVTFSDVFDNFNLELSTKNNGYNTGTGAPQTIAHGCSFTPTESQVFLSERTTGGALPYQSSAPDETNIYITAVAAKDYNWRVEM